MEHLDEIPVDDLHEALASVGETKPTQRLVAAIAYKNGVTQTELAEWYGVERKTIYSWLMRFDTNGPLSDAATDNNRSGRNRKLSEQQKNEFEQTVQEPPSEVGLDASAWTPSLVQQYVADRYDVDYSRASCRRLLKEAGLSYRNPRSNAEVDPDESSGGGKRWTSR